MSARRPVFFASLLVFFGTAAFAQSSVQVGPQVGVQIGVGGTPGPGGLALAPGPAGSQTGGIQNLPSQATTLLGGCTIPSPVFSIFAAIQPGTANATVQPLPQTSISGC